MLNFLFFIICLIIAGMGISLLLKMQRLKELEKRADALNTSLEEMDEQAKLIIRTDIELNKTQEEKKRISDCEPK